MVAVIGDIHGCFHTLEKLYKEIRSRFPDIDVYSVGDLVDRGNFSYEVVDFLRKNNIRFTAGNHDLMFYYYITHPGHPIGKPWTYNGCETTIESYENNISKMRDHFTFINRAPLFFNLEDCFISHAGISSFYSKRFKNDILTRTEELEEVLNDELDSMHGVLWTRDKLMNLGKLQVVGHTIFRDIHYEKKSNTLYIDTSAFAGNKLSAAIIENNRMIKSLSVDTVEIDIY